MWGFTEKFNFQGWQGEGLQKGNIQGGESPKKRVLGQFADLRGCLAKKRGGELWQGKVDAPMHAMEKPQEVYFQDIKGSQFYIFSQGCARL